MAKQGKKVLVIGEKPSQIKTFSEILFSSVRTTKVGTRLYTRTGTWGGNILTFLPLIGHITNIDTRKGFGWNECAPIDIAENPKALIIKEKPEFRRAIRSLAIANDELWLATDPDSEGDNIAYEAYKIAVRANSRLKANTKRVWNSSLTKHEILRAFQQLQSWSIHQALAVQGRRTIDAWVGFAGTREVTGAARKIRRERGLVLSVGRVQLPTLKLIVERDLERAAFNAQDKQNILADLLDDSRKQVLATVKHDASPFVKKEPVEKILQIIQNATLGKVSNFKNRQTKIPPPRPMNTTDAIALLARQLKIKADHALQTLATLYEHGYISYPRTENRQFKEGFPHNEILSKLQRHVPYQKFFSQIHDMTQVRTNGRKQGTEDHDPIHPTGEIPSLGKSITELHLRSWAFIVRWYLGMFMEDLIQQRGEVHLRIKNEPFQQKYQQTTSNGWTSAMTWKKPKETPTFSFVKGQIVQVRDIRTETFKTKPPGRWGDATLIRRLENMKIGTKSSRPDIIKKLELRNYITRIGTAYESTGTGQNIIKVFDQVWPDLVTSKFTRQVELQMDDVARKKVSYEDMLETIRKEYLLLHHHLLTKIPELQNLLKQSFKLQEKSSSSHYRAGNKATGRKNRDRGREKKTFPCPVCKEGGLVERTNSRTGEKFYGCSSYPSCSFTSPRIKRKDNTYGPAAYNK
ncbi:MAG: DNA topoisomerase [Candidatus Hodarchaeales archaeon]